jgi:hypothetical protein
MTTGRHTIDRLRRWSDVELSNELRLLTAEQAYASPHAETREWLNAVRAEWARPSRAKKRRERSAA